jgi:hypothetical protein
VAIRPADDALNRRDFPRLAGPAVAAGVAGLGDDTMAATQEGILVVRAALTNGTHAAPDMNVYDAARLSAVDGPSIQANPRRARPVDCPDSTRRWPTNPKLGIVRV